MEASRTGGHSALADRGPRISFAIAAPAFAKHEAVTVLDSAVKHSGQGDGEARCLDSPPHLSSPRKVILEALRSQGADHSEDCSGLSALLQIGCVRRWSLCICVFYRVLFLFRPLYLHMRLFDISARLVSTTN